MRSTNKASRPARSTGVLADRDPPADGRLSCFVLPAARLLPGRARLRRGGGGRAGARNVPARADETHQANVKTPSRRRASPLLVRCARQRLARGRGRHQRGAHARQDRSARPTSRAAGRRARPGRGAAKQWPPRFSEPVSGARMPAALWAPSCSRACFGRRGSFASAAWICPSCSARRRAAMAAGPRRSGYARHSGRARLLRSCTRRSGGALRRSGAPGAGARGPRRHGARDILLPLVHPRMPSALSAAASTPLLELPGCLM